MPKALKPLCRIQFWNRKNSLFPQVTLWGNKNWPASMKVKRNWNLSEQNGLKGLQMVEFDCPRLSYPSVSSIFWWIPFPICCDFSISGVRCPPAINRRFAASKTVYSSFMSPIEVLSTCKTRFMNHGQILKFCDSDSNSNFTLNWFKHGINFDEKFALIVELILYFNQFNLIKLILLELFLLIELIL